MKKRLVAGLIALGLGLLVGAPAWADANGADDQDSLTITITPNVNYSIDLTTGTNHLALGAVDLSQSTFTVIPATVTFGGTVLSGHECNLSAQITSLGTAWGFDTTPSTTTLNAELDKLAMYALFSSTGLASAPNGDSFVNDSGALSEGSGDSTYPATRAGGIGAGVKFEKTGTGVKQMDSIAVGSGGTNSELAHLWFYLRLPSSSTSGSQQNVQVTLTHTLGSL